MPIKKGQHISPNTEFKKRSKGFTGKHTEETKKKIREARAKQGSNVWNKGKKIDKRKYPKWGNTSLVGRLKSSLAQRGKRNHAWQGGITPLRLKIRSGIEWQLWKEKVFQRDNFTCKKCGQYGGKLSAHHIEDFAHNIELRFGIENGITFCRNCHKEFHGIYGNKKGNNLEQLVEFLQ